MSAVDYMWTGGYQWGAASRMKGDANAVAATLQKIKDKRGRVEVEAIKDAWRQGDAALRETMGDEEAVLNQGAEYFAYKILSALEYEKVNVRTEEPESGGRVFQPLAKVTGNPANVRVFVETPRETIRLSTGWGTPRSATPMEPAPLPPVIAAPLVEPVPVEVLTLDDLDDAPPPSGIVPDRDMQAWLSLQRWRERYGDIPRYAPVVAAMDALD